MKQYHKNDYNQILESVRVLNRAVSSIPNDVDEVVIFNLFTYFHFFV